MARRTELAKQARSSGNRNLAKEITELRKPTVGAWVVNRLTGDPDSDLTGLLELGSRMRAAQFELDTATMRTLGTERRRKVATLVHRAKRIAEEAGIATGPGLIRDVEETLTAAVADEAAGRAVASGRLTRTLQYSGFGEVDVEAATATTVATIGDEVTREATPDDSSVRDQAARDQAARDQAARDQAARQLLFHASERYGRAELDQATADALVRSTGAALERLQHELATLIERIEQARSAATTATARAHEAAAELERAEEDLTRARGAVGSGDYGEAGHRDNSSRQTTRDNNTDTGGPSGGR